MLNVQKKIFWAQVCPHLISRRCPKLGVVKVSQRDRDNQNSDISIRGSDIEHVGSVQDGAELEAERWAAETAWSQ